MTGYRFAKDMLYVGLPFILWIINFIILKEYFLLLMMFSTTFLGILTIILYRDYIMLETGWRNIFIGFIIAIILYFIFLAGDFLTGVLGIHMYVEQVYHLIFTVANKIMLVVGLIWIGVMEEIYWRGGLQGIAMRKYRGFPWIASSIPYTLVHIATLNPVLVVAALIVGITMGWTAYRYGIGSSSIAHVTWILMITVIAPPTVFGI